MGVQHLQKFIEENFKDSCKPVDLIKLARGLALSQAGKRKGPNRLCLVVDGESCLDRLYGGFYSDWACGGQWNRMNQFLGTLIDACAAAHMELVIYFNGAFESSRTQEWFIQQQSLRKNASQVLKHITNKATPPPKVWWIPPATLRSSLRMALRQWGVPVASSLEDHHQEVIAYCRENCFHGIVADESDYAVFDPPRYFSSQHLKLTYKGALETVEFVLDDVAKGLDLHPKRFAVMAALLGTHMLSEQDVEDFHFRICNVSEADELKKMNTVDIIKAVVEFVRLQESVDDIDALGKEVFGEETHKISKFRQTVRYYLNGTEEHFMKYRKEVRIQARSNQHGARINGSNGSSKQQRDVAVKKSTTDEKVDWDGDKPKAATSEAVEEPTATATSESFETDNAYTQHESGYAAPVADESGDSHKTPSIVVDPPTPGVGDEEDEGVGESDVDALSEKVEATSIDPEKTDEQKAAKAKEEKEKKKAERKEKEREKKQREGSQKHSYKLSQDALKIARERHAKGVMHPWIHQILQQREIRIDSTLEDENSRELPTAADLFRPIRQSVYAVLFDYNKRMLIYRNLLKDVTKESKDANKDKEATSKDKEAASKDKEAASKDKDAANKDKDAANKDKDAANKDKDADNDKDAASNDKDANKDKDAKEGDDKEVTTTTVAAPATPATPTIPQPEKPNVIIKEWSVPRGQGVTGPHCDEVSAIELEWLVPGLHKLWLGQMIEDKNRRLRAFLSSLHSDVTLMLNTSFVPQHLIVLCAVLRYIVKFRDQRVLRKHELDAFLCTAVSPLLRDVETMQEMKLPALTARGVQLGSLFMRGVEHAIFVNDACGAPVPWGMTCPWNFFDGKLFHFKLLKANNNPHLIDICDGQMDQVMRVERMRQAILQDVPLDLVFAKPPLPPMNLGQPGGGGPGGPHPHHPHPHHGFMPGGGPHPHHPNMRPAGAPPSQHQGNMGGRGGARGGRGGRGGGGNGRSGGAGGQGGPPGGMNGQAGHGPGQVDSRGGQLQIAGVVISNWGPNMQKGGGGGRGGPSNQAPPPQVTSVGPRRNGPRGVVSSPAARGRGMPGRPGGIMRGGMSTRGGQGPRPSFNPYGSGGGMQQRAGPGAPMGGQHQGPYGGQQGYRGGSGEPGNSRGGMHNGSGGRGGGSGRGSGPAGMGRGGPPMGGYGGGPQGGKPGMSGGNKPVTLEQRTKSPSGGRGRGCTVETQQDGPAVPVSQLIKEQQHQQQHQLQQHYTQQAAAHLQAQQQAQQLHQQQQAQQQQQHQSNVASQAQLAASQAQAHQVAAGHLMGQHQMGHTQVSMSQTAHLPQMGGHMNLTQSPQAQMSHAGQPQPGGPTPPQMSVSQQMAAAAAGQIPGMMSQAGGHGAAAVSQIPGLLTAAQMQSNMAALQSNMAAMTSAAELSAQMGAPLGALNGQADFGQYGGGVNLQAADLSGLAGGPNDLTGMINHAEFTMHHMAGAPVSDNRHDRIGMFDMSGEHN